MALVRPPVRLALMTGLVVSPGASDTEAAPIAKANPGSDGGPLSSAAELHAWNERAADEEAEHGQCRPVKARMQHGEICLRRVDDLRPPPIRVRI